MPRANRPRRPPRLRPADPRTTPLRKALRAIKDRAVRDWLRALLEHGECATSAPTHGGRQ